VGVENCLTSIVAFGRVPKGTILDLAGGTGARRCNRIWSWDCNICCQQSEWVREKKMTSDVALQGVARSRATQ
jgi:hypothetical protein